MRISLQHRLTRFEQVQPGYLEPFDTLENDGKEVSRKEQAVHL